MADGYATIRYEEPAQGIGRIVLARPDQRNAQNKQMLYELNDAFDRAAQDDAIKVIILAADGPHFSSGHDLGDVVEPFDGHDLVGTWAGFTQPGAEGLLGYEQEFYLGLCWRWRNIPKVTIAQVHGKVILGGLMLVWPCDLVVASRDALFSDPGPIGATIGGEFFAHVWELGARVAKRMLFTGDALTAEMAHRIGMVTDLVERGDLESHTLDLAKQIAKRPMMGLKLSKLAVNQSQEAQGLRTAIDAAFALHQLGHLHSQLAYGELLHPDFAPVIREEARAGRVLS